MEFDNSQLARRASVLPITDSEPSGDLAQPKGKNGCTNHPNSPWTTEKVARLLELVAQDLSGALIAAELGLTRNAVVGRLHRMGIKDRNPQKTLRSYAVPRGKRKSGARVIPFRLRPELIKQNAADIIPLHVCFDDLSGHHCRFPYGDGPFTYCGHGKCEGSSYCEAHFQLSIGPGSIGERNAKKIPRWR